MKMSLTRLTEILQEEIDRAMNEKGSSRKPSVSDAEQDPDSANPGAGDMPAAPDARPVPAKTKEPKSGAANLNGDEPSPDSPPEGGEEDPASPESGEQEKGDAEAIDSGGHAGEDPSGAINNEISGKTVQSITIEPKSKILPGSKEVTLTFGDTTDTLRILITPTGNVKFFWRGQLADLP